MHPIRANDPKQRKRFVEMVEAVREKGGEVLIFSSMHESGERKWTDFYGLVSPMTSCFPSELNQMSGIAAILTFPLDIEIVEEEERLAKEDAERQESQRVALNDDS